MWTTVREMWITELAESTAALRQSSSTLAKEVETELRAVNAAVSAVKVSNTYPLDPFLTDSTLPYPCPHTPIYRIISA